MARLALVDRNNTRQTELPANADRESIEFYDWSDLVTKISRRTSPLVVTGESGIGKSRLIRRVIEGVGEDIHPVLLCYTQLGFDEVFHFVAESLGKTKLEYLTDQSIEQKLDNLRSWFEEETKDGRYVTLFIDDAQDVPEEVLINLLRLSQISLNGSPVLGLVLVGLPRLEKRLKHPKLREFLSAEPFYCRLQPLTPDRIEAFIQTHLAAIDNWHDQLFSRDAMALIGALSRGIPRLINTLCSAAMFTARTKSEKIITTEIVEEAAKVCSLSLWTDDDPAPKAKDTENGLIHQPDAIGETETDSRDQEKIGAEIKREDFEREPTVNLNEESLPPLGTPESGTEIQDRKRVDPEQEISAPAHKATITKNPTTKPLSQQEKPMYRTENLNKVLKSLQTGSPDLEASALISEDGLMIASALPQDLDETRVAGMSATLLSLGARGAAELGRGEVQEVVVRGTHGYAVMINAGRGVLLLVVANENAKLGLIFFDMREAINEIKRIL